MNNGNDFEGDLKYVREVVERSEGKIAPASIYYLWAVLCLIGFPLVDFAPLKVGLFWMIAGPVGFLLSALFGWQYSKTRGQVSSREGLFVALHYLGTLVAIALVSLMVINGVLLHSGIPQVIILILALSYFTAGLYQDRPLMWMGVLLGISYVLVTLVSGPVWTIVGVAVAASLVATARIGGRRE